MRGRAALAALVALLSMAVLAALFGVSRDEDEPGAELAVAGANCEGIPATIVGTERKDTIEGTPGPDVVVAKGGDDVIKTYGDNDVICGGAGSDRISTGAGDDVTIGGDGNDWVTSVAGAERIYGGLGDETVEVTTAADTPVSLVGAEGLDLLTLTVGGTDPVLVDQAEQILILGPEPEHEPGAFSGWELVWLKGNHAWTYVGTDVADSVIALGGRLTASTYGGNDVVSAGDGDDIVNGGDGKKDAAALLDGVNACAETEWGDCDPQVVLPGARPT
ncbi:calcium-binding protein [Nocardioides stalactiti]|uniref:calcium-binding protein n=1 Tax=Nocardioides stalactiti TaxID=2755356 RepID=UPI001603E22B|nr:calcium-binding protein [Nocardioides stalactiti]